MIDSSPSVYKGPSSEVAGLEPSNATGDNQPEGCGGTAQ